MLLHSSNTDTECGTWSQKYRCGLLELSRMAMMDRRVDAKIVERKTREAVDGQPKSFLNI
jgi:hypothetical protein